MIYPTTKLPTDLKKIIGDEPVDFVIKPKWNYTRKKVRTFILMSLIWNGIVALFLYAMYVPLLTKGKVHFKSNGVPVVASLDNLKPLLVPSLIISIFLVIGIIMIVWSFTSYFQKGSIFVATPTRFIKYRPNLINLYDWGQFTGNSRINLNKTSGSIEFLLKTGKIYKNDGNKRFVPDKIEIAGISNVLEVEEICRKRIKQNAPAPA